MHKRRFSRMISAVLCGCMIGTSMLPGTGKVEVQAQETTDSEWELVSSILDSYPGVYTEDTKLGSAWNTGYSPDGPLMGNGTVYAFMAGDQKTQNLYISHSNMWQDRTSNNGQEYTTFGGITIQTYAGENLALNKSVTVSGQINDSESGSHMLDGKTNTKWCAGPANNGGSTTYWAVVDLGEEKDISRWVVKHAQAGGESSTMNTRDFKLQYTTEENPDGANDAQWTDADVVEGNTASVTDRNLEQPIRSRYIRLLVTKAEQNASTLRICELELYAEPTTVSEDAQEFQYVQDMKNAEVTAQSKNGFTTATWLSAKENILVTEITNVTEETLPLEVSAWTANSNKSAEVNEDIMIATKQGISQEKPDRESGTGTWEGWTVNVAMASEIIDDVEKEVVNVEEGKNAARFSLDPGQTVTLVSAVEGGKEENGENTMEQAVEKAVQKLESRTTADALAASKEAHREYWKNYWLQSYIDIQDEKVERMYYGMLYQLGCSTSVSSENNGGVAAGLFPWTAADHPAWQGDYTTNTDFQRQIHPLVTANRTDGIQNYINIVQQYWPEAQRRAADADHLNWVIRGTGYPGSFTEGIENAALMPTHIGPWGASTEQYNDWRDYWNSPADATSVLMPIIKLWKYTLDDDLLAELYPMMRDVATFWENYVTYEDGKYVVYGATHEGVTGRNPILDVDACKYMLRNTILAAEQLGTDSDRIPVWQDILDNMSDVPTMEYNGKTVICDVEGRTQSNPGNTFDNNPVTIQSVYYFDSIGMTASDEEKEKYYNYLEVKNGLGNHRRLISATRLGYDINEIMEQLIAGSIDPTPSDWEGMRGNNTIGDIGVTARMAIVQDSLIQSNEGFINIFANWYDDQETSFRRLRTENAFLVDADMSAFGQVTYAKIHSEKGQDCAVLNPWQKDGVKMEVYKDGEKVDAEITETNSLGDVYTFQTEAGADYELRPAAELPAIVDIVESEEELFLEDTLQLNIRTNAEDGIVWSSSDESIATVENGIVAPKKIGDVTITAAQNGNEAVSDSCVIHVVADKKIDSSLLSAVADSEENKGGDGPAGNAVDGDESTIWHSGYSSGKVKPDIPNNINNSFTIDLGDTYTVGRFDYVPRPGTTNGDILGYELWYSTEAEGENFIKLTEGTWESTKDTKTAVFDPVECRRIRLRAMSTMGGDQWISAAEFYVYKTIVPEQVSKTTLEYFLNKAKGYVEDGSVDSCVESVQKLFEEAIAEGDAVMADEYATREEVTNATIKLMRAIHALDMKAGDKTDLEMAVELGDSIDLTKYVEAGQAEFTEALAKAKEMLSDGDAFQEDIDSAWSALVDAISNLRLKADKSVLEDLINEADGIDTSLYTEESVAVFTAAFQKANAVLADETLSEDDQAKVDEAVDGLSAAIDGLEAKDGSGDGDNTGDGNTGNDSNAGGSGNDGISSGEDSNNSSAGNSQKAAKTGDDISMVLQFAGIGISLILILAGAAVFMRRKQR